MESFRKKATILVADDDKNVHMSLSPYFRREGYEMRSAKSGAEALRLIREEPVDVVLLDIMMPDLDGFEVCREIRAISKVPIIMLSAKGEECDKLLGLELGADDYITKPFSPREVVARLKAVLRRIRDLKEEHTADSLTVGNLEINLNAFVVKLDGKVVACTPKEIEILWLLVSNPGMVFSREHLLERIWGYDYPGDSRAIDSHMKRIRAKLCKPENDWDIRTVWGVGYRFEMVKHSDTL
ncbi:MAG: response regulator transcription factor [Clostridia bacterium]|nr:response regulator transcription factor [Clostridia bacterium]